MYSFGAQSVKQGQECDVDIAYLFLFKAGSKWTEPFLSATLVHECESEGYDRLHVLVSERPREVCQ